MPTLIAERYEILRLVGEGGMARVYAAYDRKHDREVAIKMLRPELAAALGSDRFLREIHIAAKLTHPSILPLFDSGEDDGVLYYVMPLIEGESLGARLEREGTIPLAETLRITQEVAEALTYAHEQGFVHRDIKPDNIMLVRGHALVADFGIARALAGRTSVSLTSTGMSLGTPLYMSPEQAFGDPTLNYSTDIYSLGCVVVEMLTGRPPFMGDSAQAVLAQHITEPVSLVALPQETPAGVSQALVRALEKRPGDRFPTAVEFSNAMSTAVRTPRVTMPIRTDVTPPQGRWWRRIRRPGPGQLVRLGMLCLLLVLLVVEHESVRAAFDFWRTPTPPMTPEEAPAGTWEASPLSSRVRMVAIGDTAVGVQQDQSLLVFNGAHWSRLLIPYAQTRMSAVEGKVLAFSTRQPAPMQRLTPRGWVAEDTVPIGVTEVWRQGDTLVVANGNGEFAELAGEGWRQLPSGRHVSIQALFGRGRDEITGIGRFNGIDLPDSLIRLQGSFGQTYDPRPPSSQLWTYSDGATLGDGASVVVGEVTVRAGQTTPLVMTGNAGRQEWHRIAPESIAISQPSLDHVLPTGNHDALMWSIDSRGLVEMHGGSLKPIPFFADRTVIGAIMLRGSPIVLTDAGTLLIRRGAQFELYGELPLDDDPTSLITREGEMEALARAVGVHYPSVRRSSRADGRLWALLSDGSIWSVLCNQGRCNSRPELGGGASDMAASRSDVVAVGHDGMVTMWRRGERELPSWSGRVARRDLRLISMTQNGTVIIAASDSLFILRPQGEVENGGIVTAISIQRNDHRLPAVLATGDSGAALVWSDKVLVIRSLESSSPIATLFSVITRPSVFTGATWTCDGKLILVSATLGDPLMGGEVEILSGPNNEIIPTKPLPFPLDLNVAVVYGDYLEVLGRGGASLLTRIPNGSSACETIPEYQSE